MAIEALVGKALEAGAEKTAMEAIKQLSEKVVPDNMKTGSELSLNNTAYDVGRMRPELSLEQMNDGHEMSANQSAEDLAASDLRSKIENPTDAEDLALQKDVSETNPELPKDMEQVEDKKAEIEADKRAYLEDVKSRSPFPDTIDVDSFCKSDFKRITPEENAVKRMEFDDKKVDLIRKWEQMNGREWPKYEKDIYSKNGQLIRRAGYRYDAHHIKPLCMGGENVAENITPLHADDHYDHQGVHLSDSPYSKLKEEV